MLDIAVAHSGLLTPILGDVPGNALTGSILAGIAVLMVLTGYLIPRRTYKETVRDRDYWRAAHQLSEEQRITQAKQIDHLLEVGHTVEAIMSALPKVPAQTQANDDGK